MLDRCNREAFIFLYFSFLLFDSALGQQFLVSRQERLALLELRSSLGLRAKEWPIKSDPCASWPGVQCTNGRVTGINISGFRRTRKGSENPQFSIDALQNLTFLASFNASRFSLPGPIPDWFGLQVNALQVLDLRSCSINGALPSSLGNLSRLNELYLSDNDLTRVVPSSLGQLSALSVLDLSRNSLTGSIPATFGNLGNLTFFDMSENFLSGMIPLEIGKLDNLRFLNLSGNSLSSSIPPDLGDLSNLVNLDLGFNTLSGLLPADLRGLRSLQRMVICNNFLSGSLPQNLFPSLTQLRFVVLSHNNFSGDFPDVLWSLPSLEFLDLSENNFTSVLPSVSSAFNTSAAVLNISNNLFYGNITPAVRRFDIIDLSGNYFEGPVPDYARGNSSIGENCLRDSPNQRTLADCTSFYADRNLVFDNFGQPNATRPLSPRLKKNNHKLAIILASIFGALGLILLVIIIILLLIMCKRKNGNNNLSGVGVEPIPTSGGGGGPAPSGVLLNFSMLGDSFTYEQIINATKEFDEANLMKRGHSGELYHGIIEGGVPVVIKKVDLNSITKKDSYISELEFFNKASNPRLVPLLGHCLENENEKFLVYKLMPNGDLSSSLFKKVNSDDSLQSLDWITRLKIAIGAAEALSYLHHECNAPFVHRDVQASSILLDDKFEVRLGSLSEVCAQESDTHQNRITRLFRLPQSSDQGSSGTSNATCAYDVYCFGKVLLELVTGKLGISSPSNPNTKEYLDTTLPYISIYDKDLVTNIVDPSLIIDEDLLEEVWAMAVIAKSCLNPKPNRRPLMRYILKALENPLKVVREEHSSSSARLRATSSRGSWNAALFGSWRHSSSDVGIAPMTGQGQGQSQSQKIEGTSSFKQSDLQGSGGQNGDGNGHSSSTRRQSKEIFPEPLEQD